MIKTIPITMVIQGGKVVMLDGDGQPEQALREHLLKAREIAAKGSNAVLVYILEMALEEFEAQGMSEVPYTIRRDAGVT